MSNSVDGRRPFAYTSRNDLRVLRKTWRSLDLWVVSIAMSITLEVEVVERREEGMLEL